MVKLSKHDQEQLEKAKDLLETATPQRMGFIKSLFFGRLPLDSVIPYPNQDPEEARRTDELIAKLEPFLAEKVDPDRIDAEERIPQEVIDGLGELGVMGLTVPAEYGGLGLSHTAYCRVLERIARRCSSTAVFVGAHQSIGLKALVLSGTDDQKRQWLPDLATGKKIAAFALSEPEVGSDAANVQTTAHLSDDGSHWILNGEKRYITNGAFAGMMTVMAKTPLTDEKGQTTDKVTAFIVTPDLPGFEVVRPNRSKCGVRGTWQAELRFTDMPVPADRILGELGRGLRVALTVLDYGRCTLSAGCVGGAKLALEMSVAHAKNRRQFNRALAEFQLIQHKLARMAELVFAMDALTYLAAGLVDRHEEDVMLETAAAKLFCSEASWRVIDDAVQIHGGEGYMRELGLERMLRDSRINRIVEGASEVMTSFTALMGMKGVGEQFEQVLKAMRKPIGNFGRIASFVRHEWRDVILGPTARDLHPTLRDQGAALARLTRRLARSVSRVLAKHREKVLDMQLLHQRIAWAAIELYTMAAVISKLHDIAQRADGNGADPAAHRDTVIGKAYCRHAADRIERRLAGLFRNSDPDRLAVAEALLDSPVSPPGRGLG